MATAEQFKTVADSLDQAETQISAYSADATELADKISAYSADATELADK
ncbi:hypothetical protein KIPB_016767, partial [Kipferlia bialata]|eukprot:g16767.t1